VKEGSSRRSNEERLEQKGGKEKIREMGTTHAREKQNPELKEGSLRNKGKYGESLREEGRVSKSIGVTRGES